MSQPSCHAVPEFMFFLVWLCRPYPSKVGLSISKLPYLTLPSSEMNYQKDRSWKKLMEYFSSEPQLWFVYLRDPTVSDVYYGGSISL